MGGTEVFLAIAIILTVPAMYGMGPGCCGDMPLASDYIKIEGDAQLLSSPYVVEGNGSMDAPYVLTGFPDETAGIKLHDISYHVVLKDIVLDKETEKMALDLRNITGCHLENVSVSNHDHAMMARWRQEGTMDLSINNSVFKDLPSGYVSTPGSGIYPFKVNINGELRISNSTISTYQNSTNRFLYSFVSTPMRISDSGFDRIDLIVNTWGNMVTFHNCSFSNRSRIQPKYGLNVIEECLFKDSILDEQYVGEAHMINNTFIGINSYIWFVEDNCFRRGARNIIKGNTFEKSSGLWTEGMYNYNNYITNWTITENYFGNCSNGGIQWDHPKCINVDIWKNIFYHNHDTTDNYTGLCQVDITPSHIFDGTFKFFKGEIGNYWRDWRDPDYDNDGIVDKAYLISKEWGSGYSIDLEDPYPATNRWFDVERPFIEITEPEGSEVEMNYVKVVWEAHDSNSGLDKVLLSTDNENWTEVTGLDYWPLEIPKGPTTIYMKAYDRAGLYNNVSREIRLSDIMGPITLISPEDGEILLSDRVDINWSVDVSFPLGDQRLILDSEDIDTSLADRSKQVVLEEGAHNVKLTCWDTMDLDLRKEADFVVDTTPPRIEIFSPSEGVTYSNDIVHFIWSVFDINGAASVRYRMDEKEWKPVFDLEEISFTETVTEGPHKLEVEAVDIAGRTTREELEFSVGPGSLVITEPEDRLVTREKEVEVSWEIAEEFETSYVEAETIELGEVINVTEKSSCIMDLRSSGRSRIKVTAFDEHGNFAMDMISINRDLTPPRVWILNDEEAVNDQPLVMEWGGDDTYGISGFRYRMDRVEWVDAGNTTSLDLGEPEEGTHEFTVECIDKAGNRARETYEFLYDITPPTVKFSEYEEPLILQQPVLELEWECQDNNGIDRVGLYVDPMNRHEIVPGVSRWEGILQDGMHTFTILVEDMAGNTAVDHINATIDTVDPSLVWTDEVGDPTNKETLPISWSASDRLGIIYISLSEDGEIIWSDSVGGDRTFPHNAEEGAHTYILRAEDLSGRTSEIYREIVVDRTPPELSSFDHTYENGVLTMEWTSSDELSSVKNVMIDLNGETIENEGENGTCSFENIEKSAYVVDIELFDTAGNSIVITETIEIGSDSEQEDQKSDESYAWLLIMLAVVLIISAGIGLFFFLKRKNVQKISTQPSEPELTRPSLPTDNGKRETLGPGYRAAPLLNPARPLNRSDFEGKDDGDK